MKNLSTLKSTGIEEGNKRLVYGIQNKNKGAEIKNSAMQCYFLLEQKQCVRRIMVLVLDCFM